MAFIVTFVIFLFLSCSDLLAKADLDKSSRSSQGLVGHWKLQGDCLDYSGKENHGINRGVDLSSSSFNGRNAFVEVSSDDSLKLGTSDFTVSAWIHTKDQFDDVVGDVVSKFDPALRKGFNLYVKASSGGYQSSGDDRQIHFGVDNAVMEEWVDCGRPSPTSNYVSNSLTVFKGNLYAATTDAKEEKDWCKVYRYKGGTKWIDCGRVGKGKTTGVIPLIVHKGELYAATTTYDWTRVFSGNYESSRVYRYKGGQSWEDCGQPGNSLRLNCIASYKGKLYVGGDRGMLLDGERQWKGRPYKVYVYEGGQKWSVSGVFPAERPRNCYPHAMAVHDGKLFVGYPTVYSFDGRKWSYVGTPVGKTPVDLHPLLQVHSLEVFRGKLFAGMWPEARAVSYEGKLRWDDQGRLGDGTEVNAFTVYNGKFYGGTIPRAEVTRHDKDSWTSIKRFHSPEGWSPASPTKASGAEVNEWTRVTSLTVFRGRLFAGIGSCTSSVLDAPADVRGRVFSMEAGKCISSDHDAGPGWRHITAVRRSGRLELFLNGEMISSSDAFDSSKFDLSNRMPLKIGFGEMDYFTGKIREVRIFRRALTRKEIELEHGFTVGLD